MSKRAGPKWDPYYPPECPVVREDWGDSQVYRSRDGWLTALYRGEETRPWWPSRTTRAVTSAARDLLAALKAEAQR